MAVVNKRKKIGPIRKFGKLGKKAGAGDFRPFYVFDGTEGQLRTFPANKLLNIMESESILLPDNKAALAMVKDFRKSVFSVLEWARKGKHASAKFYLPHPPGKGNSLLFNVRVRELNGKERIVISPMPMRHSITGGQGKENPATFNDLCNLLRVGFSSWYPPHALTNERRDVGHHAENDAKHPNSLVRGDRYSVEFFAPISRQESTNLRRGHVVAEGISPEQISRVNIQLNIPEELSESKRIELFEEKKKLYKTNLKGHPLHIYTFPPIEKPKPRSKKG